MFCCCVGFSNFLSFLKTIRKIPSNILEIIVSWLLDLIFTKVGIAACNVIHVNAQDTLKGFAWFLNPHWKDRRFEIRWLGCWNLPTDEVYFINRSEKRFSVNSPPSACCSIIFQTCNVLLETFMNKTFVSFRQLQWCVLVFKHISTGHDLRLWITLFWHWH